MQGDNPEHGCIEWETEVEDRTLPDRYKRTECEVCERWFVVDTETGEREVDR